MALWASTSFTNPAWKEVALGLDKNTLKCSSKDTQIDKSADVSNGVPALDSLDSPCWITVSVNPYACPTYTNLP
jgi:hypothetical protein